MPGRCTIRRIFIRLICQWSWRKRRPIQRIFAVIRCKRVTHSSMGAFIKRLQNKSKANNMKNTIILSKFIIIRYILKLNMSRPPSYDAFLRAQREFDNQHFGRPVYSPKEAVRENSNPHPIKHKINELLDLCKSENKDIKKEFQGVLSAEEDILMMLKEQLNRDPTTSQYVRSNVENFSPYVQRDPNMERAPKKEFFKSKVHELMDLNRPFKDHQSIIKTEQQENAYLRQEINRLKNLIPKYEAEFRKIKKSSDSNTKLFDVLEQGQKIRQETILLLKSKSVGSFSRQTEGKQQFLKELGKLRKRCQQLEEENYRLKRYSKETEYTSAPRYFS